MTRLINKWLHPLDVIKSIIDSTQSGREKLYGIILSVIHSLKDQLLRDELDKSVITVKQVALTEAVKHGIINAQAQIDVLMTQIVTLNLKG